MIRIAKGDAPVELVTDGAVAKESLCTLYETDTDAYDAGQKHFDFADRVYSSPAVRAALEIAHAGKCCYCEARLQGSGHVEHWRPKAYAQQSRGAPRQWPGYFWLAYEWSNLFWSCATCNFRKGNLFPLEDDGKRARKPSMPLEEEVPAILHVGGPINPRDHIAFHQEVPRGLTALGRRTIEVLGLDRLREDRLTHMKLVRLQRDVLKLDGVQDPEAQQLVRQAREFLERAIQTDMAFSAMVVDFLER